MLSNECQLTKFFSIQRAALFKVAGIATYYSLLRSPQICGLAALSRSKCIERARDSRSAYFTLFGHILRLRAVKSWDWDHGKELRDPTYRFELYASGWRVMGRCQRSAGILRDLENV